jgi:hypothetical protein
MQPSKFRNRITGLHLTEQKRNKDILQECLAFNLSDNLNYYRKEWCQHVDIRKVKESLNLPESMVAGSRTLNGVTR